jgi:hypothetical protein
MYQTASIGPSETLKLAQELADKVSFDLGLDESFTALQFLRDELEESDQSDEDGDDDSGDSETAETSSD